MAEMLKINQLCEITSSKRVFAKEYVEVGIPFYRGKEITERYNGKLDISAEFYISSERYDEIKSKYGVPQTGDLLLTSVGTLGSIYLVQASDKFYFKDGNITWFRNFSSKLKSEYLKYWLESPSGKAELKKSIIGSSQSAYTISNLGQMEILLPSLESQDYVISVLASYDNLIENNTRRIAILETIAQNLYREWFINFRFPNHAQTQWQYTPQGKVPLGWEIKPFTDMADVLGGGTPSTKEPEYWNGDIKFFAPKDAPDSFYVIDTEKSITPKGVQKSSTKVYPKDTVFITARGTVGKVVLPAEEMAMNQSCYALRMKSGKNQRFLFLLTKEQVAYLKKNTGGATFDTIVTDTFKAMHVTIPPLDLVKEFESLATPIFEQILCLLKKNKNLKQQRDMLLNKLFNSKE